MQKNPAYLVVILLSRVITRLDGLEQINPKVIEELFAADLAHLQSLYNEVNQVGNGHLPVTCPQCQNSFELERPTVGGS